MKCLGVVVPARCSRATSLDAASSGEPVCLPGRPAELAGRGDLAA